MGGARGPTVRTKVCPGNKGSLLETRLRVVFSMLNEVAWSNCAGCVPAVPNVGELDLGDCLTTCLEGPDSSISVLMGCKSSVAETIGNSSASKQLKRTKERERANRPRARAEVGSCRQIKIAGSASISQSKLSSNSIEH
jgi:hypothetical protein